MGYSSTFYTEHVRHQEAVAREKRIIQEHPPGIPDSDRDALMASMGYYGRPGCLTLDTTIQTADGVVSLDEVLGGMQRVLAYDWLAKVPVKSSAYIVGSGQKRIFLLETETGKRLRASAEHNLFGHRDGLLQEITVSSLRVGERIVVAEHRTRFERIVSIEEAGREDTADLVVPRLNNFILSNGVISHNSGKTLCMLYDSLERYANIHKPELGVPNGMKVVCLDLLGKGEYCTVGLPMTPNHILYPTLIALGGHPEHYPVEILRPLIFSRGRPELPYRQPKVVRPYTIAMQDITEEEWSSFVGLTEGQQRLHSAVLRKAQGEPNWPEMGMQDLYMIVQSMLGNRRIGFSPHIEGLEKADAIPLSSKVYTGREASGLLQRYERLMNLAIIMPQQRDGKPVASNLDMRKILEAKKKISVFLLPDIEDAPFLNYALARYVLERIFWFKHPNNTDRITVPVTIALPEASKSVPRKIHDENKRYFIEPLKNTVIKLAQQAPGFGIEVSCDAQRPLDLADEFRELNAVMKVFDLGEDAAEVIRELLRGRYVANYKEITDENSRFLTALRERGTFIHIGFGSIYAELCAGAISGVWYPRASGGSGETETSFYQLYEKYGKPEDWTDIGHMYAESIRINFDRQNIAAAAMRDMLDKEESEKENKKANRKTTRLGYDKPEDTITLGVISDLVKETGLDHWDSYEDFVKRLSEKGNLPRSDVYPILKRFNSRYILVDKTEGLKRQRVTILMDRIRPKLDEATKDEALPEAS